MRTFASHAPSLSLYANSCKSSEFQPFIRPDEALDVSMQCKPDSINRISCQHPQLVKYINEIGGLDLNTITAQNEIVPEMIPDVLPGINPGFFSVSANQFPASMVGISLQDIFAYIPPKRLGIVKVKELRILQDILKSPLLNGKKVVLLGSSPDTTIEALWTQWDLIDFIPTLAKMGFHMVTGINYSVFWGECPVDHAINMKRSLLTYSQMEQAGITAIPHLYWANEWHLQRWVEWLNLNRKVKVVNINCQMAKKYPDQDFVAYGINYLAQNTNQPIHFLLEGPRPKILEQVRGISNRIHIAAKKPAMNAMMRQKHEIENGKLTRQYSSLPRELLLTWNFDIVEAYYGESFFLTEIKKLGLSPSNARTRNILVPKQVSKLKH